MEEWKLLFRVYIGVILGLYWGYIGRMEKDMETTIGFRVQGVG